MSKTEKSENRFKVFLKEHKKGIAVTCTTIGFALTGLGISKALGIEPKKYSSKWFANASDELLAKEREVVRKQFCSAGDDFSLAVHLESLLNTFDKVMRARAWDGKEPGFPVHREHGWYLPNDD